MQIEQRRKQFEKSRMKSKVEEKLRNDDLDMSPKDGERDEDQNTKLDDDDGKCQDDSRVHDGIHPSLELAVMAISAEDTIGYRPDDVIAGDARCSSAMRTCLRTSTWSTGGGLSR